MLLAGISVGKYIRSKAFYFVQVRSLFRREQEKKERRKELWNEAMKGYFSDFHELRKNGGKIAEAPSYLLSKKERIRFPNVSGKTLAGKNLVLPQDVNGKISLVLLSLRAFGMKACDEYRLHFEKEFGESLPVYELSVIEQLAYRIMGRVISRNLKRQIPNERHPHFLCYNGKFADERKTLGVHNSVIGYCFLLDKNGMISWRAHATPTSNELNNLVKCTRLLINDKL